MGSSARRVFGTARSQDAATFPGSIETLYQRAGSTTMTESLLTAKKGGVADPDAGSSIDAKKEKKIGNVSGVGGIGSNALLVLSGLLVVKGLLLPEDIRHLSFCPSEDPVRGRDTLPWRMMVDSGRECGTIREVMTKYVTAPVVFPGTPEWGMMLNVKEDRAKSAWLE